MHLKCRGQYENRLRATYDKNSGQLGLIVARANRNLENLLKFMDRYCFHLSIVLNFLILSDSLRCNIGAL